MLESGLYKNLVLWSCQTSWKNLQRYRRSHSQRPDIANDAWPSFSIFQDLSISTQSFMVYNLLGNDG